MSVEIKLYRFDELSDDSKINVIKNHTTHIYDVNCEYIKVYASKIDWNLHNIYEYIFFDKNYRFEIEAKSLYHIALVHNLTINVLNQNFCSTEDYTTHIRGYMSRKECHLNTIFRNQLEAALNNCNNERCDIFIVRFINNLVLDLNDWILKMQHYKYAINFICGLSDEYKQFSDVICRYFAGMLFSENGISYNDYILKLIHNERFDAASDTRTLSKFKSNFR